MVIVVADADVQSMYVFASARTVVYVVPLTTAFVLPKIGYCNAAVKFSTVLTAPSISVNDLIDGPAKITSPTPIVRRLDDSTVRVTVSVSVDTPVIRTISEFDGSGVVPAGHTVAFIPAENRPP
jgi:hypothetical protein